ncbi:MAG: radical SAM protein [Alphaproteobacteria bacterium]
MRPNTLEAVFHRSRSGDETVARSSIIKVAGETCNINCFYCYEKRKPYANAQYLTPGVLGEFLDKLGPGPINIEIHGGEPLIIGLERMQRLLEVIAARSNVRRLSLQTNGTLLTAAWLSLFDAIVPSLEIGISLDGDEDGNALRRDYLDNPTLSAVAAALDLLSRESRACGVIAVVSETNVMRPEALLSHFAKWPSVKSVSFAPCFDFAVNPKRIPRHNSARMEPMLSEGASAPGWAISPVEFTTFLSRAAAFWVGECLFNNFTLEPIMSIIRRLEGRHTGLCHFTNLKCGQVLTLYPDGRVGSCDELPFDVALLGQLEKQTPSSLIENISGTQGFNDLKPLLLKCTSCSYHSLCGGGCLATRLRYQGTDRYEAYCDHRIAVIEAVRSLWATADASHDRASSQ